MEELPKNWTAQDARRGPLQEAKTKLQNEEPEAATTPEPEPQPEDSSDEKN